MARSLLLLAIVRLGSGAPVELHEYVLAARSANLASAHAPSSAMRPHILGLAHYAISGCTHELS
eukprot:7941082-Alexandrium_andersonii.AAC.1